MALQGFVASWVTKNERARKLRTHLCGNTLRTNPGKCQSRDSSWRLDAGPLLGPPDRAVWEVSHVLPRTISCRSAPGGTETTRKGPQRREISPYIARSAPV